MVAALNDAHHAACDYEKAWNVTTAELYNLFAVKFGDLLDRLVAIKMEARSYEFLLECARQWEKDAIELCDLMTNMTFAKTSEGDDSVTLRHAGNLIRSARAQLALAETTSHQWRNAHIMAQPF
jgi:hypothetical protein